MHSTPEVQKYFQKSHYALQKLGVARSNYMQCPADPEGCAKHLKKTELWPEESKVKIESDPTEWLLGELSTKKLR
jgi:hypothetical protein